MFTYEKDSRLKSKIFMKFRVAQTASKGGSIYVSRRYASNYYAFGYIFLQHRAEHRCCLGTRRFFTARERSLQGCLGTPSFFPSSAHLVFLLTSFLFTTFLLTSSPLPVRTPHSFKPSNLAP